MRTMSRFYIFVVPFVLFSLCFCELSDENKDKFLNGFISYLNNVPNQPYAYEEGVLLSAQNINENTYKIEVRLRVTDLHSLDETKFIKCWGTIVDLGDNGVTVLNRDYHCLELNPDETAQYTDALEEIVTDNPTSTEVTFERRPVQLDNEVQPNNVVSSGEQFIAVPRRDPTPCIGCAAHVNIDAVGVPELAQLAVRHLDVHEPNVRHTLRTVHDVERQVQVVNGVRYILTLTVDYNNCTETETDACLYNKVCKISVLEKPWIRLADGSKFRAILANNCTEQWLYGDDGEIISQNTNNMNPSKPAQDYDKNMNTGSMDDDLKRIHNIDLQGQQQQEKTLTEEELKHLQEQIIPHNQFEKQKNNNDANREEQNQNNNLENPTIETMKHINDPTLAQKPEEKEKVGVLSEDKKKAIDDMINFFNFAGFDTKSEPEDEARVKRSYESDLEVMSLTEKYQKLKKNIYNAKQLYILGQAMVDYLNEMDMEVKTRILKDVFSAEEESENNQNFFYIQAHVIIPCDKADCRSNDEETKICNGVIDNSNPQSPQILNSFCYNDDNKKRKLGSPKNVPFNDPILLKLTNDSIKKIESELSNPKAMRVQKMLTASTQRVIGTLTKISFILEYIDCNKSVSFSRRGNCTALQYLGTKTCDVEIHERHWIKEKKIMYTCTDRRVDETFADIQLIKSTSNFNDPKVIEIAQEALQYLEVQSNRNNKQKIVEIKSVTTQIVAGLLTNVEFSVGYTECTNDIQYDINSCELLKNEQLRQCKAQVWERPWLEDGRQVTVTCNDKNMKTRDSESIKLREKRSIDYNGLLFVGGEQEQDPKNPKYFSLAQESLQEYLYATNSRQYHKVVKVNRATTQVVSGTITRIDFEIIPTNCLMDDNTLASLHNCDISHLAEILNCHSSIIEQPWVSVKNITVDCKINNKKLDKRDIPGGINDGDRNNPKYKTLADEALLKYLLSSGGTQHLKVIQIEKVSTQIVAGSLTKIDFSALPTNCQIDSSGQPSSENCEVQTSDNMIYCKSEIWKRAWLNETEITVNCYNESNHRYKRDLLGVDALDIRSDKMSLNILKNIKRQGMTGGISEADVDEPRFRILAEKSLEKFLETSGIKQDYEVVRIVKATTQVVSGSMTRIDFTIAPASCKCELPSFDIYICHSEIWEQPWLNNTQINVQCNKTDSLRIRSEMYGSTEQDPTDSKYKNMAEESLTQYLQASGITQQYIVMKVAKVSTYNVSGLLTNIEFTISATNCQLHNNSQQSSLSCDVQNSTDVNICNSELWQPSWQNKTVINVNCAKNVGLLYKQRRQELQSPIEDIITDPMYRELAEESMQQFLNNSGIKQPYEVMRIINVMNQSTSGLTKIDFSIAPASCKCDTSSFDMYTCNAEITQQPSVNIKNIKIDCKVTDQLRTRTKRDIPGGQQEEDPNDSKFWKLAEESLEKYLETSDSTQHYVVVQVDKVTTQTIAGILTTIDFKISPTNCQLSDLSDCILAGNGQPSLSKCKVRNADEVFSCHSEIIDESSVTKQYRKNINIDCMILNKSSQDNTNPGGLSEHDSNDPKFWKLAEEALNKYLETSGATQHHTVIQVDKVTTQIVAGIQTEIDFKISPTNCQLNSEDQPADCVVQDSADVFSCHTKIWEQPWLNKKDIDVNCHIDQKLLSEKETDIVGGQQEQNPEDPKFRQLAEEGLKKYLEFSGITQYHVVVHIEKVTTQVINGIITRINFQISPTNCQIDSNGQPSSSNCDVEFSNISRCHSNVFEQPWQNLIDIINVNCTNRNDSWGKMMLLMDRVEEKDPNDPAVWKLAEESLGEYLKTSDVSQHHIVSQVDKATIQHVSGIRSTIDFKIRPTNCKLDSDGQPLSSNCVVQKSANALSCHSEIWEQDWLNKKNIKIDCQSGDNISAMKLVNKLSCLGCITEQDPNKPEYRKLAEESMVKYLEISDITQHHTVVKVLKVTTGVVAGILTRIDFEISPTNCQLDSGGQPSSSNCVVQSSADALNCHSEIWERVWLNSKEIKVNCSSGTALLKRKKRGIPGGETENYSDDPEYRNLAEKSLVKYLQISGNTRHHTVVQVDKVTTQVVSGSLTKIDFKISPTNCQLDNNGQPSLKNCEIQNTNDVYSCQSEIWEQSWLNKTEINVNCSIDNHSKKLKRSVDVRNVIEENANEEKFRDLAEESIAKYLLNNQLTKFHKLINIDKVTTQIVSGNLTTIDFKIAPTNCELHDISEFKEVQANCVIGDTHTMYCRSIIWDRGLKNESKVITVACNDFTDIENSEVDSLNNSVEGVQNSSELSDSGIITEEDPSKEEFRTLAEESLREYQKWQKIKAHHRVVEVNRVITQIVSGIKYKIDFTVSRQMWSVNEYMIYNDNDTDLLRCQSVIWDRPWLNTKEIKVDCHVYLSEEFNKQEKGRTKRSMGGPQEKDPNDDQYKELANEALLKYQNKSNVEYLHKIDKIHRVTEQVVAGIVTNIMFTISPTVCLINDTYSHDCQFKQPKTTLRCNAEIKILPRPHPRTVKVNCVKKNKKKIQSPRQRREEVAVTSEYKKEDVILTRERRQLESDDDYVDEELKYYYADRAISDYNSRADTNNLFKVITIHDVQRSVHMKTLMVRMYLEIAMTYCMREGEEGDLHNCEEIEGLNHKLCLARLWPSPDDELVVQLLSVVCNDEREFESVSGLNIVGLIKASIAEIEKSPHIHFKMVHQGESNILPSLDYRLPIRLNFVVAATNCTKDVADPMNYINKCFIDLTRPSKSCTSYVYMQPNTRSVHHIEARCRKPIEMRKRRSVSLDPTNATVDELMIQNMVQESIDKLEMASSHRYKQRVLVINSYSSKIVTGKLTTIDFDVGYTSCLKYEWVDNNTSCEFLEHLPRRHCISQVWERLWINNGRHIEVNCEDDETPLEAHIEFESAENAMQLANEALKHIEAKYPNPYKQRIVRIFSIEKQAVAGLHYRMKLEVGLTQCPALSIQEKCKAITDVTRNKFCRVNVWLRLWTDHPPSYRITCDYQDTSMADIYYQMQAEYLFFDFLKTYKPEYMNNHEEMQKRFEIFKANVKKIHELNVYERGTARYAVTRFADLSEEEFSKKYLGLKPSLRDTNLVPMRMADIPEVALPDSYDWREFDAVTEVKDQGSCGSCWAFSVTGNIEGQWKMQSGKLVSLSEQELVDCDKLDSGCNGGLPDNAYRAIEQLGGLETEADYPYEGEDDKCSFNKSLTRVQISGAVNISSNETDMAKWLVQNGPISIGINANAMQFYVGGISHPWKLLCNPKNLDHGVLIVGYGIKDYPLFHKRLPYWIIKNSWGSRWGEQGYYRVFRGDGTCGVNMMASSAVI